MANRNWPSQRLYTQHLMAVNLDVQVSIGAAGAPTIVSGTGKGVTSITRLKTGTYQIQLNDNYTQLLGFDAQLVSPAGASPVTGGSFVIGTVYQIVTMGNTTQAQWVAAGVPAGITAAVGVVFLAATVGAGTGTAAVPSVSGANAMIELIGNPQLMLNNQPFQANQGGYVNFQTLGPTAAGNTAPIPTDPANGSMMTVNLYLSNSSVQ